MFSEGSGTFMGGSCLNTHFLLSSHSSTGSDPEAFPGLHPSVLLQKPVSVDVNEFRPKFDL